MPQYDHLVIGGGMTAAAAVGGIREVAPNAIVGVISAESHRPPRHSLETGTHDDTT
jgi:hypothetical protein